MPHQNVFRMKDWNSRDYSDLLYYKDKKIGLFTLSSQKGLQVQITNFGGRIVSLKVPDRDGVVRDVVHGFSSLADYLPENHLTDFGATIGRYANRIAGGNLNVEGKCFQLPQNNGLNCLHGGPDGWQYAPFSVDSYSENMLKISYVSPDGDNGFPGEVSVIVTFTLDDASGLTIHSEALTTQKTVINMTNHSYFNLSGDGNFSILNHQLEIAADYFLPVDESLIPTGELRSVVGTPFDFRTAHRVGERILVDDIQLKIGNGYDHCWCLNKPRNLSVPAAILRSPESGIVMECFTDEPGVQIYTGNFLDGKMRGKRGVAYKKQSAICIETQKFPDSPHHHWPQSNPWLNPEEKFESTTQFRFSVQA